MEGGINYPKMEIKGGEGIKMVEEKKGKIRSISLVKGRLQASIPATVLTALHLSEGDELEWKVEGNKAIAVKKEGGA